MIWSGVDVWDFLNLTVLFMAFSALISHLKQILNIYYIDITCVLFVINLPFQHGADWGGGSVWVQINVHHYLLMKSVKVVENMLAHRLKQLNKSSKLGHC